MLLTKLTTVAAFLILLGIAGAGAGLVATSAAAPQTADGARRGGEIDDLRKELQDARQEIEQLKLALRRAQQPASQPRPRLYRGKPVRHWVEQLTDGDPSYRKEAIVVLGVISRDDQTVIESLLAALRDQDEEVRLAAAHSLGDAGAPAVPRLMALLKPEGATSTLAALALANVGAPAKAAVPALIELLHSRNSQARQAAATALARIGPAAKAALPALVQALKNDGDDREAVAEALVQLDPATSAHFGTLRGTPGVLKDMTKAWQKAAEELEKKYPPQPKEEPRQ